MTRMAVTVSTLALSCILLTACAPGWLRQSAPPKMPSAQELATTHAHSAGGSANVLASAPMHYRNGTEGLGVAFRFARGGRERFALGAWYNGGGEAMLFSGSDAPIVIGRIGFVGFVEGFIQDPKVTRVKLSFAPSGKDIVIDSPAPAFVFPVPEDLRAEGVRFTAMDAAGRVIVDGPLPYPNSFDSWNG